MTNDGKSIFVELENENVLSVSDIYHLIRDFEFRKKIRNSASIDPWLMIQSLINENFRA